MTKKKVKPSPEQTVKAAPEPKPAQKLDEAIRAKGHNLRQTAVADLWRFVEKPDKDEFDPDVLELLAAQEILDPPSLLEGALAGQMLNGLVNTVQGQGQTGIH